MKILIKTILFFCLIPIASFGQVSEFEVLHENVLDNNRKGNFEKSLTDIVEFIDENQSDNYLHYKALVLKSYTYKSLFNYTETIKALDEAYEVGIKSDKKEEIKANITLEKAYALFDILKYDESYKLIQELKKNNYKYIESGDIAGMIMQEAYINYKKNRFDEAEKMYDEAIILMKKANPKNLPIIYGKKMELYSETKERTKAIRDFNLGMKYANHYNILKYKIYMYEMLREQLMEDNDWKAAFKSFQKIDSMKIIYNAQENSNKIQLLEKDLEIQKKDSQINKAKFFRNSLLIICLLLLIGIYLFIRLYKSNKEKSFLLEKENTRIHDELQILTSSLNSQGFTKIDLSQFKLSERQLEIIELVRLGKSNKEIANQIFISENTVKYHLKAIYEIMNIENRSEFFKFINNN